MKIPPAHEKNYKYVYGIGIPLMVILGVLSWYKTSREILPTVSPPEQNNSVEMPQEIVQPEKETVQHIEIPEEVRGIYWTATSAGGAHGQELLNYMKKTGLNTAVIDLKLDNGALAYQPKDTSLAKYASKTAVVSDFPAILKQLGNAHIYRIARIAIMRDTRFTTEHPDHAILRAGGGVWRDKTGAGWVDPASPLVAEYAKALAREAYAMGFDEIQFDYVRFASDGSLSSIRYSQYDEVMPKYEVMRHFFDSLSTLRAEGIPISFDVFGMTFWSASDFNIGQRLEDVYPNADFISPMVYPSHYPPNFDGFADPALAPYAIVKRSLDKGAELLQTDHFIAPNMSRPKFRPWLQDFDIGAIYTSARIEAEIKATRDAGASGWILWNARNVYEPATYVQDKS